MAFNQISPCSEQSVFWQQNQFCMHMSCAERLLYHQKTRVCCKSSCSCCERDRGPSHMAMLAFKRKFAPIQAAWVSSTMVLEQRNVVYKKENGHLPHKPLCVQSYQEKDLQITQAVNLKQISTHVFLSNANLWWLCARVYILLRKTLSLA